MRIKRIKCKKIVGVILCIFMIVSSLGNVNFGEISSLVYAFDGIEISTGNKLEDGATISSASVGKYFVRNGDKKSNIVIKQSVDKKYTYIIYHDGKVEYNFSYSKSGNITKSLDMQQFKYTLLYKVETRNYYFAGFPEIAFQSNDGSAASVTKLPTHYDSANDWWRFSTPDSTTRDGYTFKGWSYSSSATSPDILAEEDSFIVKRSDLDTMTDGVVNLYAVWEKNCRSYIVTFQANGHGVAPAGQTVKEGDKVAPMDDLNEEGYVFGGWYKDKSLKTKWNFTTDVVTSDVTLYAKWTAEPSGGGQQDPDDGGDDDDDDDDDDDTTAIGFVDEAIGDDVEGVGGCHDKKYTYQWSKDQTSYTGPEVYNNGKDVKNKGIVTDYNKSFSVKLSDFQVASKELTTSGTSISSNIASTNKILVATTSRNITNVNGVLTDKGKISRGSKDPTTKASYNKKTGVVTVVATGKLTQESVSRVWIIEYQSENKKTGTSGCVVSYSSFLVRTRVAPASLAMIDEEDGEGQVIKQATLNIGGTQMVGLQIKEKKGTTVSAGNHYIFYLKKDADATYLDLEDKGDGTAVLEAKALKNGKKTTVSVIAKNLESQKTATLKVTIVNDILELGLSEADVDSLHTEYNSEDKKKVVINVSPIVTNVDGTTGVSNSTDTISVATVTALEPGEGYTLISNKFKVTAKSKTVTAKWNKKSGKIMVTIGKDAQDNTSAKLLVVIKHADKTVDVVELGIVQCF